MLFSSNQVAHLYVAKHSGIQNTPVIGDIAVASQDNNLYFKYIDATGNQVRSDMIPIDSITYASAKKASDLAWKRNIVTFTVTSVPAAATEFNVKVIIRNAYGISEYDAMTRIINVPKTSSISSVNALASAISTAINKDAELSKFVTASTPTSNSGVFTITEVDQPWILGTMPIEHVLFDVMCEPVDGVTASVLNSTFTYDWATCAEGTTSSNPIGNGKMIADLEYFAMGERGDQYRNVGWPHVVHTDYLADSSKTYDVITLHYAYQGTCEDIQKSEKDIIIVVPTQTTTSDDVETVVYTTVNAIIGAINTATGATAGKPAYMATLS